MSDMEIRVEVVDPEAPLIKFTLSEDLHDAVCSLVKKSEQFNGAAPVSEPSASALDALDPLDRLEHEMIQDSMHREYESARERQRRVVTQLCDDHPDAEFSGEDVRALAAWFNELHLKTYRNPDAFTVDEVERGLDQLPIVMATNFLDLLIAA